MALIEADRLRVMTGMMRFWSRIFESHSLTKSELKAAIDATDDWIESNQSSFNTALPSAAQTGLTAAQKTVLFCGVSAYRVSKSFAVRLFGGVD